MTVDSIHWQVLHNVLHESCNFMRFFLSVGDASQNHLAFLRRLLNSKWKPTTTLDLAAKGFKFTISAHAPFSQDEHQILLRALQVPYRTVRYRTVPYGTVPYRTVPYRTVPYRTVPYRTVPYPQSLQDLAAGEMHLGSDSISHHISREYFCWSRSAAQILRHMGTIAGARTRARAIEVPSPASNYCPDESLQFCRNMHLVTSVVSPLTQQVLACS